MNIKEGWGPQPTTDGAQVTAAALSAPRRRVLDVLGERPMGATAVASVLALHVNTAREHLDGLVEAGLAVRSRLAPSGRGRPAWGYAAEQASATRPRGEYAALASVLADFVVEQSDDVAADMTRLGRNWGRRLMAARSAGRPTVTGPVAAPGTPVEDEPTQGGRAPDGSASASVAAAEAAALVLMEELGFAPEGTSKPIRLKQCPMLAVAKERPDVVCSVHLGLIEGALQEQGVAADGVRLDAFAARDACLLRLH